MFHRRTFQFSAFQRNSPLHYYPNNFWNLHYLNRCADLRHERLGELFYATKCWRFEKFKNRDNFRQEKAAELFYALSREKRKQKTRLIDNLLSTSKSVLGYTFLIYHAKTEKQIVMSCFAFCFQSAKFALWHCT